MKHASSALVLDYWNDRRKHRAAPERGDIDPAEIRQALGDPSGVVLANRGTRGKPSLTNVAPSVAGD